MSYFAKGYDPRRPTGRPKGSRDKVHKKGLQELLDENDFDPALRCIQIGQGKVACGSCVGTLTQPNGDWCFRDGTPDGTPLVGPTGKETYILTDEAGNHVRDEAGNPVTGVRACQTCRGTGYASVDAKTMLAASQVLLSKLMPDLKAVEHTGDSSERNSWKVVVVQAPQVSARPMFELEKGEVIAGEVN